MLFLIFSIGACFGSFAVLAAERGLEGKSIISPPSQCSFCKRTLNWYEKIPIISYCYLKGQSSCCNRKIPFYSIGVEIFSGFIWFCLYKEYSKLLLFSGIAFTALIIISLQDFLAFEFQMKWLYILCVAIFLSGLFEKNIQQGISLLAALFTGILFLLIFFVYPDGMGNGDGLIAVTLSYSLGKGAFWFLCLSFIFAGVYGLTLLIMGQNRKSKLPLIPFLLFGYVLAYFGVHP